MFQVLVNRSGCSSLGKAVLMGVGSLLGLIVTASSVQAGYSAIADSTGSSKITVFNDKGRQLASFFAYDPTFTGGVRVGSGDVNGDGFADLITAPNIGAGPIQVIDGTRFGESTPDGVISVDALLTSFNAYDQGFTGGVRVAAGDVNGDGRADIITGAGPGGGPHVRVFDGASVTPESARLTGEFLAYDASFTGGVFVGTGDINGDGFADIVTGAGPGGGPHVRVFDGQQTASAPLFDFFAFDAGFTGGVRVATGDINGDGRADIITSPGAGGGPHVRVFDGTNGDLLKAFDLVDPSFLGGAFVAAGDVNGDAIDDVLVGSSEGERMVRIVDGTAAGSALPLSDDDFLLSLPGGFGGSAVAWGATPVPAPTVLALVLLSFSAFFSRAKTTRQIL